MGNSNVNKHHPEDLDPGLDVGRTDSTLKSPAARGKEKIQEVLISILGGGGPRGPDTYFLAVGPTSASQSCGFSPWQSITHNSQSTAGITPPGCSLPGGHTQPRARRPGPHERPVLRAGRPGHLGAACWGSPVDHGGSPRRSFEPVGKAQENAWGRLNSHFTRRKTSLRTECLQSTRGQRGGTFPRGGYLWLFLEFSRWAGPGAPPQAEAAEGSPTSHPAPSEGAAHLTQLAQQARVVTLGKRWDSFPTSGWPGPAGSGEGSFRLSRS